MGIERLSGVLGEISSWETSVDICEAASTLYKLEVALVEATTGNVDDIRALGIVYEGWQRHTSRGTKRIEKRGYDVIRIFDKSALAIASMEPGGSFEHKLLCRNYRASVVLSRDMEGSFSISLSDPRGK